MNLPYATILKALKTGPMTLEALKLVDKEGDTAESVLCLVARGLVQALDDGRYQRNEEALEREANR